MSARPLLIALLALAAAGCGVKNKALPPAPSNAPTYWGDVQPLLAEHCTTCHAAGGIAPFTLTGYAEAQAQAANMAAQTKTRVMPPWPPGEGCNSYTETRSLSDAQIDLLARWAASGAQEGTRPANPTALTGDPQVNPMGRDPDLVVANPRPYVSPPESDTDDYHCFVSDPGLTADRDVVGVNIVPGNGRIVHHVILYEVEANHVADLAGMDPTGNGYTCFGDAHVSSNWVAAWAPGGTAQKFPETTGIRLHAGSKLVMQVHYNLLNGRGQSDQSKVQLYFSPTPVQKVAHVYPIPQLLLEIPANQKNVVVPFSQAVTAQVTTRTIWGIAGHMHLLGTAWRMELKRAATNANVCLLDLPQWNFHWQGMYFLDHPVTAEVGDSLNMTCVYDNTAAHQPIINGVPKIPTDVTWGESTTDEMCLGLVYVTE